MDRGGTYSCVHARNATSNLSEYPTDAMGALNFGASNTARSTARWTESTMQKMMRSVIKYDNVEVVSATSKEKKIRSNLSPDISGVSAKTQQKPEYCDLGDLCRERG